MVLLTKRNSIYFNFVISMNKSNKKKIWNNSIKNEVPLIFQAKHHHIAK